MKNLYIIGNGFDVHHGIPSMYTNYMKWLVVRYPMLYEEVARTFRDAEKDSWWAEFESHLAGVEYMYNLSNKTHAGYVVEGIELKGDNSAERLTALYKAVQKSFSIWVEGLNTYLDLVKPDLTLTPDAQFLSFNYTNTLQDIYGISDERVLHIHGKASRGDEIIIGHDSNGDAFQVIQSEIVDFFGSGFEVGRQISAFKKPTGKIIEANKSFFESLTDVEQIIVMGFSFSSIDMPYIKEIIKNTHADVLWTVYVHSDKDRVNMKKVQEELKLNVKLEDW